jgi:energy-coupling factor transport system ATP-binding protein
VIEISGLRYAYPGAARPALAGIDLALAAGERLLVAGPSGSGKSTLLRCLDGLVPHFHGGTLAGRLRVAGLDPVAAAPAGMAAAVGMLFQDPEAQVVAQRVEDEVAFALENHGLPPAEIGRRVGETLERLGAAALARRRVDTLSGGERQRVALAAALALRPPLVALDEPTSQLDPGGVAALLDLLDSLHRTEGLTLVVADHRLGRVIERADRACLLPAAGAPPRVGAPAAVLADSDLAPPVARLGRALGWDPPPLTLDEARRRLAQDPRWRERLASYRTRPPGDNPPTPGEPVLLTRGLRYRYPASGAEALAGADLTVRRGEVVALLGANGSGKSTLLKALVGLVRPDAGEVEALGRPLGRRPVHEIARGVGLVPQNPGRLLFADRVADEVRFTRRAHGLPEGDPAELLERLGIADLAGADPRDLSGGERQRAAIAAILAAEPPALLLDEPTRGLDAPAKAALARLLRELAAGGAAVVVATHDAELVADCASRAVLIDTGRVTADGPPAEVLPGTPFEPEISRLFGMPGVLTVDDALAALGITGTTEGTSRD